MNIFVYLHIFTRFYTYRFIWCECVCVCVWMNFVSPFNCVFVGYVVQNNNFMMIVSLINRQGAGAYTHTQMHLSLFTTNAVSIIVNKTIDFVYFASILFIIFRRNHKRTHRFHSIMDFIYLFSCNSLYAHLTLIRTCNYQIICYFIPVICSIKSNDYTKGTEQNGIFKIGFCFVSLITVCIQNTVAYFYQMSSSKIKILI